MILRSIKISLDCANAKKREKIEDVVNEYKDAVNYFLDFMASDNLYKIDEEIVKNYESALSYRYKQAAKRQAINIRKLWRKTKKKNSKSPTFGGSLVLDKRHIQIEKANNTTEFDYWLKISTLDKQHPIYIPFKSYEYANMYFDNWNLVNGGRLQKENAKWYLILTFETEETQNKQILKNKTKAIDIGYRKLIATSDREILGDNIKRLTEKAANRKQGSKKWKRTKTEIKYYTNRMVKELFELPFNTLVIEDLKNLKQNKHGKWSKKVNRRFNLWLYSHLIQRIKELGEQRGVRVVPVEAAYTSQRCPECGYIAKSNRKGEIFTCQECGYKDDADFVGAINILARFEKEFIVPSVRESSLLECSSI